MLPLPQSPPLPDEDVVGGGGGGADAGGDAAGVVVAGGAVGGVVGLLCLFFLFCIPSETLRNTKSSVSAKERPLLSASCLAA